MQACKVRPILFPLYSHTQTVALMMTNYTHKGLQMISLGVVICVSILTLAWYARTTLSSEKIKIALIRAYVDIDDLIDADHVIEREGPPNLGELVYPSVEKVIKKLRIGLRDIVYDLKSGAGKLPICMYLKAHVRKTVGVEPSETYFTEARKARKVIQTNGLINGYRRLEYVNEDPLQVNLSDATVILMCSPYFLETPMQAFADKFLTLKPGLRIITLQKLPEHPRLKLVQTLDLATSWADSLPFYCYKLLPSKQ